MNLYPYAFNRRPQCVKCDARGVDFRFCFVDHGKGPVLAPIGDLSVETGGFYFGPEHLDVTCRECGYIWLMQTADSKAANTPNRDEFPVAATCPVCRMALRKAPGSVEGTFVYVHVDRRSYCPGAENL